MSKYYFHIRQGQQLLLDEEGLQLKSVEAAYLEAQQSAMDLSRANIRAGLGLDASTIEIFDDHGRVVEAGHGRRLLN